MRKLVKITAAAGTILSSLGLLASKVAAQYEYDWDYDYDTADSAFGSLCCFGNIFVMICGGLLVLVLGAFNLWMLIDVIQRDEKVLPGKIKWILVILLVPFGSVAYYFMRKKTMDAMK